MLFTIFQKYFFVESDSQESFSMAWANEMKLNEDAVNRVLLIKMMMKVDQVKKMQSGVCFCYFGKAKAKKNAESTKGCFYYNMKTELKDLYQLN